jgi:hypothetical protein
VFVSIKGSPRRWFEAALMHRDAAGAWAAAHELGRLTLPDALALCLLLRDRDPARLERAAARYPVEDRGVLDEAGFRPGSGRRSLGTELSGMASSMALPGGVELRSPSRPRG